MENSGKEERMKERTLSIIKPDGVSNGLIGEVIKRFETAGFRIVAMKMVKMSKKWIIKR